VNWLIVVLRFLHIFFGVFWAGAVFTMAMFVLPTVAASGPEGQRFMFRLTIERGLVRAMIISGTLAVLAGLVLIWHDSAGFQSAWMESGIGVMLSIGGLAAIGALATGFRSAMLASRLGKLIGAMQAQGSPPTADQQAQAQGLGARLAKGARAVAVQLVIAVLCMAVARYVVF
jgi:uncharacterized membrane protein